jgi:RimJ/RimL family protein N-acetyltransferase
VLKDARERQLTPSVIATVDKPNKGSIRVLEKLGFEFVDQIYAYESPDMFLYKFDIS